MFPAPKICQKQVQPTGEPVKRRSMIVNPELYLQNMEERAELASKYLETQGYSTKVLHGQRISVNNSFDEHQMEQVKWNEIFIGKLPRDIYEDELLPHLEMCGQVFKIRLMMDFSRTNRGFCFVKYANTEQAAAAISYLNGRTIVPDKDPIGARISFDNKCLFFSDLPGWCTEDKLISALRQAEVEGIVRACMSAPNATPHLQRHIGGPARNNKRTPGQRRPQPMPQLTGYAVFNGPQPFLDMGSQAGGGKLNAHVYFETHFAATQARRLLLPGEVKLFNRKIKLDWARSVIPDHVANLIERYSSPNSHRRTQSSSLSINSSSSSLSQSGGFSHEFVHQPRNILDSNNNNITHGDVDHHHQHSNSNFTANRQPVNINISNNPFLNENLTSLYNNHYHVDSDQVRQERLLEFIRNGGTQFSESDLWSLRGIAWPKLQSLANP